jgi:hypothetical protein
MSKQELETFIEANKITMDAVFVPFSQSRNKDNRDDLGNVRYSLNWKVTIKRDGRDILTTDYMAGSGHCPSENKKPPSNWNSTARAWRHAVEKAECEAGFACDYTRWAGFSIKRKEPIMPSICDVLYCFASDAEVLNAGGFEDWASEYGYDVDSRKAEGIYRACLEIALKLRNGLGEAHLAELQTASQDY